MSVVRNLGRFLVVLGTLSAISGRTNFGYEKDVLLSKYLCWCMDGIRVRIVCDGDDDDELVFFPRQMDVSL